MQKDTDCHVAPLLAMTGFDGAVRDMGCGVGKTTVGRSQCAPPLGMRRMSAAAHMGAALQGITGRGGESGGVEPCPYAGQDDFHKMSFRGAKRHGNPFSHVAGVRRRGITDCHTGLRTGSQ